MQLYIGGRIQCVGDGFSLALEKLQVLQASGLSRQEFELELDIDNVMHARHDILHIEPENPSYIVADIAVTAMETFDWVIVSLVQQTYINSNEKSRNTTYSESGVCPLA